MCERLSCNTCFVSVILSASIPIIPCSRASILFPSNLTHHIRPVLYAVIGLFAFVSRYIVHTCCILQSYYISLSLVSPPPPSTLFFSAHIFHPTYPTACLPITIMCLLISVMSCYCVLCCDDVIGDWGRSIIFALCLRKGFIPELQEC